MVGMNVGECEGEESGAHFERQNHGVSLITNY